MRAAVRWELSAPLLLGAVVLLGARAPLLSAEASMGDAALLRELSSIAQLQRVAGGAQAWSEAWLGWPQGPGLAQLDWLPLQALLAWPLRAAGLPWDAVLSGLTALGLLASAWLAWLLARRLLGEGPQAWLVGAVTALAPLLLGLGPRPSLLHAELGLGGALLLARGLAERRALSAGAGAALLAGASHAGWWQGGLGALLALVVLGVAIAGRWGDARSRGAAVVGALLGALSLLPVALPMLDFAARTGASPAPGSPLRWAIPALLLLSVGMGPSLQRLALRLPPAWRPLPTVALLLGLPGAVPSPGEAPAPLPAIYLGLEAAPPGPLYERFTAMPTRCACEGATRLRAALEHGRPLAGASAAWDTPAAEALEEVARFFPEAQSAELLRLLGVAVVIEHSPVTGPPPEGASCQEVEDHRLCVLEPLLSEGLPAPGALTPLGDGPVRGLRWRERPRGQRLEIRCEGQRPWRSTTHAWDLLGRLRYGLEAPGLEVILPEPCPSVPTVSEGSPVPLYAGA